MDDIKSILLLNNFFSIESKSYTYNNITNKQNIYQEQVHLYIVYYKKLDEVNKLYINKLINVFNNELKVNNVENPIYINTKDICYLILCVNKNNDIIGGTTLKSRGMNNMEIYNFTMNKTDYILDASGKYLKYKGLGNTLMDSTLSFIKTLNKEKVFLYFEKKEELLKFYGKHGFISQNMYSMERFL